MNIMKALDFFNGSTGLTEMKDPFSSSCVQSVTLRLWKMWPNSPPKIYANVEFENGNTKGEQKIEADSMNELIKKVETFLKTLDKR